MRKRNERELFRPAPLPVARLGEAERLACLRLIRSENVGPAAFRELINLYGGASAALAALPAIARRSGRGRTIAICPQAAAEEELEAAQRCGARPIFTIEPDYPMPLAAIDMPPPLIYVKGRSELMNRPAIAIVGSRDSSAAGMKLAAAFASAFGQAGYGVVSGLARGIDAAAHKATLELGTIAVVAGGIDVIYPPEHAALQARIATDGCLVSDRAPGSIARAKDFPRRNRIISGISRAVVVVEAAARSGTLVTARFANEQGREVFAVPGHPLDPRAEGTNGLIKQGATLVTTPADVMDALAPFTGLSEPPAAYPLELPRHEAAPASPPPEVGDPEVLAVLSVLGPMPCDIDAVVAATGMPIRVVQVVLLELELSGQLMRPGPGLVALHVK